MAGFTFRTLASSANGPLVQSISVGTAAQLTFDMATGNTAAFAATAAGLVNQDLQTAEANVPEQTRMQLIITGWAGQAGNAANAVNAAWRAGKVNGPGGHPTPAWPDPGYSSQIAWASNSNNDLVLRWVKAQPMAYILVGVLIVAVGVLVYHILTSASWSMSSASLPSPSGGSPTTGSSPVPVIGGTPFRILWLPWYDAAALAAGLAAAPFLYHKFVEVEGDRVADVKDRLALRRLQQGGGRDG